MKRILLFLGTNLAIVLVLSFTMRLLGVEPYLNENGLNLGSLLIFAAVMGFGGSLISLAISKWTAKRAMGVRVIETPSPTRPSSGCRDGAQVLGRGRHQDAGGRHLRCARRQRVRHRHEQEQFAHRGLDRPAAADDPPGSRSGASATKWPTPPMATW
jgi:Zn-dependent protease with chaperone function